MATAYYYDIAKLYEHSYINGNVDEKLIKPTLLVVQDVYVLPLIGTGIYEQINTQIIAGSVSAANQTLLNSYIQPAILWWVMYEFTLAGSFKYMNKGVMQRSSESANAPDITTLEKIAKPHLDKSQHYADRVTRFLLQNPTTYPLYLNAGNGIDTVFPDFKNFSSGMNLDDEFIPNSSLKFSGAPYNNLVTPIGKPIR